MAAPNITVTPSDATRTYTSLTSGACSVSATGVALSLDDTRCRVRLSLAKTGFKTVEHIYAFDIGPGIITLAGNDEAAKWGTYAGVAFGAGAVDAPSITPTPTTATKVYESLTDQICTVDADGAVTPLDDADCEIRLTLSAPKYDDLSYTYDFTIAGGTITVAGATDAAKWGSYGTVTVGEDAVDAPATGTLDPSDVTTTYSSLTGTVCSVDSDGAVTGLDDDACEIKLVLAKENYSDLEYTYSFNVATGTIRVAGANAAAKWGSYGTVTVGGGAVDAPQTGTITPSDATLTYTSTDLNVCTVDNAGAVTGVDDDRGNCTIRLTLSRDGYSDKTRNYTFAVNPGTQTASWSAGASTGNRGNQPRTQRCHRCHQCDGDLCGSQCRNHRLRL